MVSTSQHHFQHNIPTSTSMIAIATSHCTDNTSKWLFICNMIKYPDLMIKFQTYFATLHEMVLKPLGSDEMNFIIGAL